MVLVIILSETLLLGCTGKENVIPPTPNDRRVIDVKIVDTDDYQGPMPRNLTGEAGELIELRITNEDHRTRNNEIGANYHPIVLRGPGINVGIPDLSPGDTKSIIFTAKTGMYTFSCANGACDIHTSVYGAIEIFD